MSNIAQNWQNSIFVLFTTGSANSFFSVWKYVVILFFSVHLHEWHIINQVSIEWRAYTISATTRRVIRASLHPLQTMSTLFWSLVLIVLNMITWFALIFPLLRLIQEIFLGVISIFSSTLFMRQFWNWKKEYDIRVYETFQFFEVHGFIFTWFLCVYGHFAYTYNILYIV